MDSAKELETDVLIIGGGPTGLTAALALASYGVRCHMVSRWNWMADTPRAHITNQRTMEVFRDLGVEKECYKYATPWDLMGDSLFTTSLAGDELLRIRAWGTAEDRKGDYLTGSPCELIDLPQHLLEPILFKNAAERGASFSCNTEYLSHSQDEQGVTALLEDRLTGRQFTCRSKYLIGADGARSKVFEDLGLELEGQLARAATAYVIFKADLSKYVAHRPSILHWIVSPHAAFGEIGFGLLRAIAPWDQWIAGWGFDMSKGEPDLSDETVLDRIRMLVGDPYLNVEIQRKTTWYVNQAYAPVYSKGKVFCAGDACHRHPPSSGLGLNTCVQDAFNLAWKISYVLKGYASESLLESFSLERAPVGKQVVKRANQSRLDYAPLKAIFRIEGEGNPVEAAINRFRDPGADGVKARAAAREALELKNREFNAQGVELNQRYFSNAVLNESAELPAWSKDPELYLVPSTVPGAKIPHVWLIDRLGHKLSTLDVVGKGRFVLITGLSGQHWKGAAKSLDLPFLDIVVVGELATQDPYCDWQRYREVDEDGAILVRPDGYVAWRRMNGVQSEAEAISMIKQVLSSLLASELR